MIIGIGCDTVDIERVEKLCDRFGDRFINKILSPEEQHALQSKTTMVSSLAKRFAAKEACFKALGTGLRKGMCWHDICILNDPLGAPTLTLRGASHQHALQKQKSTSAATPALQTWISLSDTAQTATAMVILEIISRP